MINKSKVNPRRYAKREIRPCVGVGDMARKVMPRRRLQKKGKGRVRSVCKQKGGSWFLGFDSSGMCLMIWTSG